MIATRSVMFYVTALVLLLGGTGGCGGAKSDSLNLNCPLAPTLQRHMEVVSSAPASAEYAAGAFDYVFHCSTSNSSSSGLDTTNDGQDPSCTQWPLPNPRVAIYPVISEHVSPPEEGTYDLSDADPATVAKFHVSASLGERYEAVPSGSKQRYAYYGVDGSRKPPVVAGKFVGMSGTAKVARISSPDHCLYPDPVVVVTLTDVVLPVVSTDGSSPSPFPAEIGIPTATIPMPPVD